MWAISGSDLGQISPIIWTPPFLIPLPSAGQWYFYEMIHLNFLLISFTITEGKAGKSIEGETALPS